MFFTRQHIFRAADLTYISQFNIILSWKLFVHNSILSGFTDDTETNFYFCCAGN